jgi:hypothetical protein
VRKVRTRIVMESEEILVTRCAAKPVIAWCPECRAETTKLTVIEAALLCRVDEDTMQRWVRTGHLHVLEGLYGLLICLTSLAPYRGS